MKKLLTIALSGLLLGGCAMPTTTVKSVDSRPGLAFSGASDEAELLIDGLSVGKAADFNGSPRVLTVEPGTHRVTVRQGAAVLYDQQVFIDSETKTIRLR